MTATLSDFYRDHFPIIVAKCARMLENEMAQDIAQETFLRLWQSPVLAATVEQRVKWIYRTATHLAIDSYRQRRRRRDRPLEEVEHGNVPAPTVPDSVVDARRTLAALAAEIPNDELEVAILHRLDGLTQAEIAALLGRSDRTVRRLLERLDVRLARRAGGGSEGCAR